MEKRQRINLTMSGMDLMRTMGEGNPGALSAIAAVVSKEPEMWLRDLLSLDDMNIRGSQLYVGYNDFAGRDIDKFITAIRSRSKEMVDMINQECSYQGEVAVTHGHSFK